MTRAGLTASLLLAMAGCQIHPHREITESRTVDLGGAESVRMEVQMGAGELNLSSGARTLLEGTFRYGGERWKPELKYDVSAGRGYLTLKQPSASGFRGGDVDRWELRVNDKVPLELRVRLGAGQSKLRVGGLELSRLGVEMGAGQLDLDLNGLWRQDLTAHISGGVGHMIVRLPREFGVRVKATGGIGGISAHSLRQEDEYYLNDAYGHSKVSLRLEITGGIGQIDLIG